MAISLSKKNKKGATLTLHYFFLTYGSFDPFFPKTTKKHPHSPLFSSPITLPSLTHHLTKPPPPSPHSDHHIHHLPPSFSSLTTTITTLILTHPATRPPPFSSHTSHPRAPPDPAVTSPSRAPSLLRAHHHCSSLSRKFAIGETLEIRGFRFSLTWSIFLG
ncbi:hypothetical protein RND81_13G197000 [Saponaria officinalis]|uniref:Uncharacterized protein n=1 Tax=Saponaria officinalis TaxID=3572 RepID=A0AAW1H3E1_SAPOF